MIKIYLIIVISVIFFGEALLYTFQTISSKEIRIISALSASMILNLPQIIKHLQILL